jgi:hypothetical protein
MGSQRVDVAESYSAENSTKKRGVLIQTRSATCILGCQLDVLKKGNCKANDLL